MPLNTSSFLVSQGWEGVGVPLDGKAGKGLKKPLAIPQKRTLSGIGKDRDRANEWWNSIFTAGAKNLNIGPSKDTKSSSTSTSGTNTPSVPVATIDDAAAAESAEPATQTPKTGWSMGPRSVMMSLSSLAKREHARKTLMSNFVRGEVIASKEPSPEPVMQVKLASTSESVEASDLEVEATLSSEKPAKSHKKTKARKEDKLERKIAKEKRKRDREACQDASTSHSQATDSEKVKSKKSKLDKRASDGIPTEKKKKKKKLLPPEQEGTNVLHTPKKEKVTSQVQASDLALVPKKPKKTKEAKVEDGLKSTKTKDKKQKKDDKADSTETSFSKKRKRDKGEEKAAKKKKHKS